MFRRNILVFKIRDFLANTKLSKNQMFRRNIGWVEKTITKVIVRSVGTMGAGICAYRLFVFCWPDGITH
jgi:hypothetical protein